MSWARLLKRVFDMDIEQCPNCGSALKIIACPEPRRRATIEDPPVIVKILSHLAYRPAPRRQRVESICSKRSEQSKTACQRKPTARLALTSTERAISSPARHLRSTRRSYLAIQDQTRPQLLLDSVAIDRLGALAIYLRSEKGWFKIPIHRVRSATSEDTRSSDYKLRQAQRRAVEHEEHRGIAGEAAAEDGEGVLRAERRRGHAPESTIRPAPH
jgi:hypothetical protein